MSEQTLKSTILLVDDEPNILSGLKLQLRRDYRVLTAPSGEAGLDLVRQHSALAVIISDMRMPEMDGAEFLATARKLAPEASRILLTGYADVDAAIRAVNQGQLFRFLTKPCPPDELAIVVRAAVAQHRLLVAEHELLEKTLFGSVEALSDALMLAEPEIYGGISEVRRVSEELGQLAGVRPLWPLRVAAMLAFVGYVGVPREVAARAVAGETLSREEQSMVGKAPATAAHLLAHIPRLESVRAILELAHGVRESVDLSAVKIEHEAIRQSAAILRVAIDFTRLTAREVAEDAAVSTLRERGGRYDAAVLDLLSGHVGEARAGAVYDLGLRQLRPGMVLAEGCRTHHDVLVAAKGYVITESFLQRVRNFKRGAIVEPVRVQLPAKSPRGETPAAPDADSP